MKQKRIIHIFLLFFAGSILGWVWEVFENYMSYHNFTNRGFLHGPWLPIYGAGIIFVYFLKKHFGENPAILFAVSCITFGLIEYVTGWYLEKFYHSKWWDYSYEFMNLQGRICLKYVVLFAVGGCLAAYYLLPLLQRLFSLIPVNIAIWLCVLLTIIFLIDVIYSINNPNTGIQISDPVFHFLRSF